jgi:hypothetical protein
MPALLPACFFLMSSCTQVHRQADAAADWQNQRMAQYRQSIYPRAAALIATGDVVTRLGSDMTSELFRQMNHTEKAFSHCGVASVENDTVFVYHIMGGELHPDQTLIREPLFQFAHASENKAVGIFRPALGTSQVGLLIGRLKQLYAQRMMFDMRFDFADDSRQYCAELIAKALCYAAGDSSWLKLSQAGKLSYVAVDQLYKNSLVQEVGRFLY